MHKNILSMNLQMFADNATLNYAESYQQALQKRYSENGILYSQKLWNSPSNNLIKWAGAKTVTFLRVCYWIAVWISSKTIIKRSIHYPYQ